MASKPATARTEPFFSHLRLRTDELDPDAYPLCVPAIRACQSIRFHPAVTIFAGENGTGKSTLVEAIAMAAGFSAEGGTKSFRTSAAATDPRLSESISLARGRFKEEDGFFLRAESVYNLATYLRDVGGLYNYGGDLHAMSHGESFINIFLNRFDKSQNCLFILDELEAALSPRRQLEFLGYMHRFIKRGSMFVISTHSPILMSYPNSRLYWLSEDGIEERHWKDTSHFHVYQAFINRSERMIETLLHAED